jgi:D-tyrosyl-tRNA(Tyr) deacylase
VEVDGQQVGSIGGGLLILIGVTHGDTLAIGRRLLTKATDLRIFEDQDGKMNRSLRDLAAEESGAWGVLLVSQFTLYADARKGRRPSFTDAAAPDEAEPMIAQLIADVRTSGIPCESGRFGAHMKVSLVNDGPVSIMLDSADFG